MKNMNKKVKEEKVELKKKLAFNFVPKLVIIEIKLQY